MCNYETTYYDHEGIEKFLFRCEEKELKDGFCIFHHPEYWKKHPKKVAKEFYKKVEFSIKNKQKLFCSGYNLPDISLSKEFSAPIYFDGALFNGKADFSEAKFNIADFNGAIFNERADFCDLKNTKESFQYGSAPKFEKTI